MKFRILTYYFVWNVNRSELSNLERSVAIASNVVISDQAVV